jgi:hypothetical protein
VNNITHSDSTNPYSNVNINDITPVLTGKRMRSLKASRLIYGNETFDQTKDSHLIYKTQSQQLFKKTESRTTGGFQKTHG